MTNNELKKLRAQLKAIGKMEITYNEIFILYTLLSIADYDGIIRYKKSQIKKILLDNKCISNKSSKSCNWILNQIFVKLENAGVITKFFRFKLDHFSKKIETPWCGYHFYYKINNWELAYLIIKEMPQLLKPKEEMQTFLRSRISKERLALTLKLVEYKRS